MSGYADNWHLKGRQLPCPLHDSELIPSISHLFFCLGDPNFCSNNCEEKCPDYTVKTAKLRILAGL